MAEIDWGVIGKELMHPIQRDMLEALAKAEEPMSVTGLQRLLETKRNVQNLSYHANVLRERGWIKKSGTRRVRGAVEQFWVVAPGISTNGKRKAK